jgi:hypothetical protein
MRWASVGVDLQVCKNFSIGGAQADYAFKQANSGSSHVTVFEWVALYYGQTCIFVCFNTYVVSPQFAMTLWVHGKRVFGQNSPRGSGYISIFGPEYMNTDDTGYSNIPHPTVPVGATIDFDLWVEADHDVRGKLTQAHVWQALFTH